MNLVNTEAVTGYFECIPSVEMTILEILDLLDLRPMDTYLHRHALSRLCTITPQEFGEIVSSRDSWSKYVESLFFEASFIKKDFKEFLGQFNIDGDAICSPLINLKSVLANDRDDNQKWISLLRDNIVLHRPFVLDDGLKDVMLRSSMDVFPGTLSDNVHIKVAYDESLLIDHEFPKRYVSAAGAYALANAKLIKLGILHDSLMRHVSSLSPVGLLQKWKLERHTKIERNIFGLSGIHTAYGKGLTLDDAMASCIMEVVERYCSYADSAEDSIIGYQREYGLTRSSFSDLSDALDPSTLKLEVPYANESLWWMDGEQVALDGRKPIKVPAQLVFLFSNLDEIDLFSGLGSTGLAAHTDISMAKIAAILECIERDRDTVSIFDPSACFRISTRDTELESLFKAYSSKGIFPQFQDISGEIGIPCYRCFVVDKNGAVVKGTGAGLSSKKALLSALMETPYPFPHGTPSGKGFGDLPTCLIEDLPDYETGNPCQDLYILERILNMNRYEPVYVDLTRADIGFPVVKAIIPGLEIMNDFDEYSRVSPRMKAHFLKAISRLSMH